MERKAPCRCETIQCPAATVASRSDVILPLIQEDAGLLPAQQVGVQLQTVHLHSHRLWNFASHHTGLQSQRLQLANRDVVALHDPLGREKLFQTTHYFVLGAIHALGQSLDSEIVAVAVDHQPGKPIPFAMNQPVSF